tara:strand:+ start:5677 stop:6264 length:588 start_codon:yes stop_codon:yes gene_type:complete
VCFFQLTRPILVHRIYDEESDRHIHIPFEQAMKATGYGALGHSPTGDIFKLGGLSKPDIARADKHAQTTEKFGGTPVGAYTTSFSAIVAMPKSDAAECLALATALEAFVAAGCWCPIEIVVARPFIEHLMISAIITVAGRDTGATLFGPAGKLLHTTLTLSSFSTFAHTHICYRLPRFRFALGTGSRPSRQGSME